MTDYTRPPGKTTIAPEVLTTIARMAALSVEGVSEMAPVAGGVNRFFKRGADNGVQITIHENIVGSRYFHYRKRRSQYSRSWAKRSATGDARHSGNDRHGCRSALIFTLKTFIMRGQKRPDII